MQNTTSSLITADGLKLHLQYWLPDSPPKASIMLVHGINEHTGRYHYTAEKFTAAGYAVAGLDHRSHGKSEGQPRSFVHDVDEIVNDLELLWQKLEHEYPDIPHFMVGHSMGGLLSVRFTLRHQHKMQGLVTSGVALAPGNEMPAPVIHLAKLIAHNFPTLPLVDLAPENAHCSNPEILAMDEQDTLSYNGKLRAGMGMALMRGIHDTLAKIHWLTLPMLILHGTTDLLANPKASQMLYDGISSDDKTLKFYPGLYHEIFNEVDRDSVLADVTTWLDNHI